jgi:hypothetical protein
MEDGSFGYEEGVTEISPVSEAISRRSDIFAAGS